MRMFMVLELENGKIMTFTEKDNPDKLRGLKFVKVIAFEWVKEKK